MTLRILVVVAGVAAFGSLAPGQQSSSAASSPVASSSTQPPAAPTVSVGPNDVRPVTSPNEPKASAQSTSPQAAPQEPVPNPNAPASNTTRSAATKVPHQASNAAGAEEHPYTVGPLDVLDIRVWNDSKLSGMYPVRPDGMISMPLIGELKADGLSVPALSDLVKQKLSSVMNDPEVNIQVAKINSKRVFVFGGVLKPGEMPLYENMTVLDALSNVGFKDFANPKKITIMRGTQIFHFNYKDASKGKHMEQNIYLQNGDRIFVPE